MSDFSSWDQVEEYLTSNEWNKVVTDEFYTFSELRGYCHSDCGCVDEFDSVEDTMERIKDWCDDNVANCRKF